MRPFLFRTLATIVVILSVSPLALGQRWVGTWATSPQHGGTPPPGFGGNTLRQFVHVSIGGHVLRVRFSNQFGATPLTIQSVHLAIPGVLGPGAIQAGVDSLLLFQGQPSVTIPPGAPMLSDPIHFDLAPLSNLAVTIRFQDAPRDTTTHNFSIATSYLQLGDAVSTREMPEATKIEHWYFLTGVDVLADQPSAAIVALGDSITDGNKSTPNKNARFPDVLARLLRGNNPNLAVLNEGISGEQVVRDGPSGLSTLVRLDRDALAQAGARWVLFQGGTNDLGFSRTKAKEIIAGYEQVIARVHAVGLRIYGETLLPWEGGGYYHAEEEPERQAVNAWIRTSGKFDAVIDLDAAVRDPRHPSRMSSNLDSGDHLHPNDEGYRVIAQTIAAQAMDQGLFAYSTEKATLDSNR